MAADRRYVPDVLISSTAVRCRQTAEAVRRAMSEEIEPIYVDQLYNGSLSTYLSVLDGQDSPSAMLIGHNPTIEEALEALVGADQMMAALPRGYPPAGLAVLDYHAAGPAGQWRLIDFLHPGAA